MGLLHESRYPFKCSKELGIKRHPDTLERWHRDGLRSRKTKKRVFLEAIYEGQCLVTSAEAVRRFLAELNGIKLKG